MGSKKGVALLPKFDIFQLAARGQHMAPADKTPYAGLRGQLARVPHIQNHACLMDRHQQQHLLREM